MAERGFWKWLGAELTRPIRPRLIAWLATISSVGLLATSSHNARLEELKPEVLVLWATLIALIWTAFHTYQLVDQARTQSQEEKRRRTEIAKSMRSAVIGELEEFDRASKLVFEFQNPIGIEMLPQPQLRQALARPDLFDPIEMAVLSQASFSIRSFEATHRQFFATIQIVAARAGKGSHEAWPSKRDRNMLARARDSAAAVVAACVVVLKEREVFSLEDLRKRLRKGGVNDS